MSSVFALEDLAGRCGVRDCVMRVAWGADHRDEDALRSAFWADARVRFGGGVSWSVDEFVASWRGVARLCAATQHLLFNDVVELDGDTAFCESYYFGVFLPERDGRLESVLPFC